MGTAQGSRTASGMSQKWQGESDELPGVPTAGQSKHSSNWLDLSKSDVHLGWGWGEGAGKGLSLW